MHVMPECVLSFNMDWRILVNVIPRFWLGIKYYSLMFSWQVEFWLAKKVLLKLHGSRCHLVKCVSSVVHNVNGQHIGESDYWFSVTARLPWSFKSTFLANQNSTCKAYYRIYTLRHIRIEINHGNQNVFWVLTWIGGY
jgi:hypothetical protein